MLDAANFSESQRIAARSQDHDPVQWRVRFRLWKFWQADITDATQRGLRALPYEMIEDEGNLLVTAGATRLLTLLIGGGGASFSAPYLGVGDSSTAAAIGQTDLQA